THVLPGRDEAAAVARDRWAVGGTGGRVTQKERMATRGSATQAGDLHVRDAGGGVLERDDHVPAVGARRRPEGRDLLPAVRVGLRRALAGRRDVGVVERMHAG